MKFATYMAFSFITFLHILLVPFSITVYMAVCCVLLFNFVNCVFLLLCLCILIVMFIYSYCYIYIFLLRLYILIMFIYSYCYVCSVLCTLFHCVVLFTVCV
jgi:hypothetical protein